MQVYNKIIGQLKKIVHFFLNKITSSDVDEILSGSK